MTFSRLENFLIVLIITAVLTTGVSFVLKEKNKFGNLKIGKNKKINVQKKQKETLLEKNRNRMKNSISKGVSDVA